MIRGEFIPLASVPAICEAPGTRRAAAQRLWTGHVVPGAALCANARSIAERCPDLPGRVHSLGDFNDGALHLLLSARLPGEGHLRLRERFEWYACRGAGFHNDAHYAGVLFGAWCIAGPLREIVFPRASLRVPAAIGNLVIFDPFEPHAVLDRTQGRYERNRYQGAPPSVFVGAEIDLDDAARAVFGVEEAPARGVRLASAIPINAETGALP